MTPTGIENLLVIVACYTLAFLWVILPEPALGIGRGARQKTVA